MTDARLVEAVVRAVLAQVSSEAPCACHAVPGSGACPLLDRLVAEDEGG